MAQEADDWDSLDKNYEKEQETIGYEYGLEQGRKAGKEEGSRLGEESGAKVGSELGYIKGFTTSLLLLLKQNTNQTAKTERIVKKLSELSELVDQFPKTNEGYSDEKLSHIGTKFKQLISMLNVELK